MTRFANSSVLWHRELLAHVAVLEQQHELADVQLTATSRSFSATSSGEPITT